MGLDECLVNNALIETQCAPESTVWTRCLPKGPRVYKVSGGIESEHPTQFRVIEIIRQGGADDYKVLGRGREFEFFAVEYLSLINDRSDPTSVTYVLIRFAVDKEEIG